MEEREKLLRELKVSGKTTAEFSRERGIPVHRLYSITKRERVKKPSGTFVRVGGSEMIKITVSATISLEVPVECVREVLGVLGISTK